MERYTRRTLLKAGAIAAGAALQRAGWTAATVAPSLQTALRAADEEDMVVIPAGPFLMGTSEENAVRLAREHGYHPSWLRGETPERRVALPAYAIDRYPVTNAQFARFCEATGHEVPTHWSGPKPAERLWNHPVVTVNRADALAYAAWAGKRLPTETEWEKAARGPDGLAYPWGNAFEPEACCWNRTFADGTMPVDAHPKGASPYGVMDLAGNVAEWCADGPVSGAAFARGGCFLTRSPLHLRAASRFLSGFDRKRSSYFGFRCVKESA